MINIHRALLWWAQQNGNRQFSYDDKEGLIIHDGKEVPDLEKIKNDYAEYKRATEYIDKRKAEYPSIADQLDMLYHDHINGTTKWIDTIKTIKNKYPKVL